MKYRKWYYFFYSSIAIPSLVTISSCNRTNTVKEYNSNVLELAEKNEMIIIIEDYFSSNIEDFIVVNTESNKRISIDYEKSKVLDNKIYLNIVNLNVTDKIKVINKKDSNFVSFLNIKNKKTLKKHNISEEKNYFFNLVENMSSNNIPTIIDTRSASLLLQQSSYISLINYFENYKKERKSDYSIFITEEASWSQERFLPNTLIDKGIWNGIKDLDLVTNENIGVFNLLSNTKLFSSPEIYVENFKKIMEKFKVSKFDFVMSDIDFKEWFSALNKDLNFDKLSFILKFVNRIIVISDGAIHTNVVVPFLENKLNNFEPSPRDEVIKKLEDYQSGKIKNLTSEDICDFILLKNYETTNANSKFNFISFVNYDSNIKNTTLLNDKSIWNETMASTNFLEYSKIIKDENDRNLFLRTYSDFFMGNIKTNDEIIVNGFENWDSNKKTLFFLVLLYLLLL